MLKKILHINQHAIKKNRNTGSCDPVITCKTYKSNQYAHQAIIYDSQGSEIARLIYRPSKPLSCGAHVWLEVYGEVKLVDDCST